VLQTVFFAWVRSSFGRGFYVAASGESGCGKHKLMRAGMAAPIELCMTRPEWLTQAMKILRAQWPVLLSGPREQVANGRYGQRNTAEEQTEQSDQRQIAGRLGKLGCWCRGGCFDWSRGWRLNRH
jgi:hypothetical protein